MRYLLLNSAVLFAAATAAQAAMTLQDLDITGDGFATFAEVKNVMPRMDMVDFNAIDSNGDMRLSAEEVSNSDAQVRLSQHSALPADSQAIRTVDVDGDNFITWEEMSRAYPAMTQVNFQSADQNSDGRLSYVEYYDEKTQVAIAQCVPSTFLDLASMDGNGDKFLDMEELKVGYPKVTASDFNTIDLNSDNRISALELLAPTAQCLEGK